MMLATGGGSPHISIDLQATPLKITRIYDSPTTNRRPSTADRQSPAGLKKVAKRIAFLQKNGFPKCARRDGLRWTPMGTQELEKACIFYVFSRFNAKN